MQNKLIDERVSNEADKLMSEMFFLQLCLVVIATIVQMFFDRPFIVHLPAIIGCGGAIIFVLLRYAMAGLLFSKITDERIETYKIRTKSLGCIITIYTLVFGGFVLVFFFDMISIAALFAWWIPALIHTIRSIKKGIDGFGSKKEEKKGLRRLKLSTAIGALFFGLVMAGFDGAENVQDFALRTIAMGATWGILFYWLMKLTAKISDKRADRLLEKSETNIGGDNE